MPRFQDVPRHGFVLLCLLALCEVVLCNSGQDSGRSWSTTPLDTSTTETLNATGTTEADLLDTPPTVPTLSSTEGSTAKLEHKSPTPYVSTATAAGHLTVIPTRGTYRASNRSGECQSGICSEEAAVTSHARGVVFAENSTPVHSSTTAGIDSSAPPRAVTKTAFQTSAPFDSLPATEGTATLGTASTIDGTSTTTFKSKGERRKSSSQRGRHRKNRLSSTPRPAPEKKKSYSKNSTEDATNSPVPHQNDPPWNFGPSVDPDDRPRKDFGAPVMKKVPTYTTFSRQKYEPNDQTVLFWKFGPGWKEARKQWGSAWEYHVYFLGTLFGLLGASSLVSIVRLKSADRLLDKRYLLCVHLLLLVASSCRSVFLLYDPYDATGRYHPVVAYLIFDSPYPCLSSAFAVLFLAFLNTTKVQLLPPKAQRPSILGTVVVFHFCFSTAADIVVGLLSRPVAIVLACQVFFLTWTFLLSIAYFYIFQKLYKAALRKQSEMIRLTFTKLHIDGAELPRRLPRPTLATAVKMALLTAFLALLITFLKTYGIISVYSVPPQRRPDPWCWWGFHLTSRVLELATCATILCISTQPTRHHEGGDGSGSCEWNPCIIFKRYRNKEASDDETYANQYTSQYGFRNENFNTSLDVSRPWEPFDPDLAPSFQNPGAVLEREGDDNSVAMMSIPRPTAIQPANNPNASHSLLSSKQSRSGNHSSSTDGRSTTLRTLGALTTASEGGRSTASTRPPSMLYKDNGFIRFRKDDDPEQPQDASDDEEEESDSLKAHMGSSIHTLCEDEEIGPGSLSPFFHGCLKQALAKGMSGCSLETTDVSSDQLSNVTRNEGFSASPVLDLQGSRRYGSTCSSESAANSFDVAFYLGANVKHHPQRCCCPHHGQQEDVRLNRRPGKICARSVSPIICRTSSRRSCDPQHMKLNLTHAHASPGLVNASCGTEDITPDSAVYLDLHLSPDDVCQQAFSQEQPLLTSSFRRRSSMGHSLNDLNKSSAQSSGSSTKSRRSSSRGILNRLRGSTFSLNASFNGYEPLESDECSTYFCGASLGKETKVRIKRSCSEVRPRSALETRMAQKRALIGELCHGDSGMLDSAEQVQRVDGCSQTDPIVIGDVSGDRLDGADQRIVPIDV